MHGEVNKMEIEDMRKWLKENGKKDSEYSDVYQDLFDGMFEITFNGKPKQKMNSDRISLITKDRQLKTSSSLWIGIRLPSSIRNAVWLTTGPDGIFTIKVREGESIGKN